MGGAPRARGDVESEGAPLARGGGRRLSARGVRCRGATPDPERGLLAPALRR